MLRRTTWYVEYAIGALGKELLHYQIRGDESLELFETPFNIIVREVGITNTRCSGIFKFSMGSRQAASECLPRSLLTLCTTPQPHFQLLKCSTARSPRTFICISMSSRSTKPPAVHSAMVGFLAA